MKIAKTLALTILCTSLYASSVMAKDMSPPVDPWPQCSKPYNDIMQVYQRLLDNCNARAVAQGKQVGGAAGSAIAGKALAACDLAFQQAKEQNLSIYNTCVQVQILLKNSQSHGW